MKGKLKWLFIFMFALCLGTMGVSQANAHWHGGGWHGGWHGGGWHHGWHGGGWHGNNWHGWGGSSIYFGIGPASYYYYHNCRIVYGHYTHHGYWVPTQKVCW